MADSEVVLQFQDIPHDSTIDQLDNGERYFDAYKDRGFHEDDKNDSLLGPDKKNSAVWKFEYYQQFFDVDTPEVLARIIGSVLPRPGVNYLERYIARNPDLYGPFWICVTLIFSIAIAGNVASYITHEGVYTWQYDFHKVLTASLAVFSYWWLAPCAVYAALWWRRSQASLTFTELLCVYGYSLSIYVPISILWVIQVAWFQWTLVILGSGLSGVVLVIALWPAMKLDRQRHVRLLGTSLILLCHALLAASFVLYFFRARPACSKPVSDVTPASEHSQPMPLLLNSSHVTVM